MARIEDYALIGDLQTAALVSRDGLDRLVLLPAFRLRAPASPRCWAGPTMAGGCSRPTARCAGRARRYRHDTLILESVYETDDGSVRVIDFMPPRGVAPDIVRIVEGLDGDVPMRSELVIRFDYGKIVPWVRRVDDSRLAIAGPDALCLRTPRRDPRRGVDDSLGLRAPPGERLPFVLTWFPSHTGCRRRSTPSRRSTIRSPTGASGPTGAAITATTTTRSTVRSSSSKRSRTRRPAASWRHRRRRCRSTSGACATGTIGSAGCEMQR